ncbi:MAG: M48 family metalloprotease [candidate division NC10 bacterium]|nr:M48 family metalloprotease [candidate division NC10 bacterium]
MEGRGRRWAIAGALLLLTGCEGVGGRIGPVDLGVVSSGFQTLAAATTKIGVDDEVRIGRGVAARLLAQYGFWADPALGQYVTLVGQVLVQPAGRRDLTYHFAVLNDTTVNAFSAPGGYIFVTRGALAVIRDEAELAGVLAHEIAHVSLRHVLGEIENRYLLQKAGETGTRALGAYGGSGGQSALAALQAGGEVFSQIADFATEVLFRGYSRSQEIEADRLGVEIAAGSGYNPHGLTTFLETVQARSVRQESATTGGLMRTHPVYRERLEELRAHIRSVSPGGDRLPRLPDRYAQQTRGRT